MKWMQHVCHTHHSSKPIASQKTAAEDVISCTNLKFMILIGLFLFMSATCNRLFIHQVLKIHGHTCTWKTNNKKSKCRGVEVKWPLYFSGCKTQTVFLVNQFPPVLFPFIIFVMEISSHTPISLLMPGSDYIHSVSWDDCGQRFPD